MTEEAKKEGPKLNAQQIIAMWRNAHGVSLTTLQSSALDSAVELIAEACWKVGWNDAFSKVKGALEPDEWAKRSRIEAATDETRPISLPSGEQATVCNICGIRDDELEEFGPCKHVPCPMAEASDGAA